MQSTHTGMQLSYWKTYPNFGDRLNPYLWPRIFPDLFVEDADELFLGIGTILWRGYPPGKHKHVFGAGYGGGPMPKVDENWTFHFVRGPKTARAFALSEDQIITDPAILLHSFVDRSVPQRYEISLMPHWSHVRSYHRDICRTCGIHYISPLNENIEQVLSEISASNLVIAEAMHGAIVADALRIPWIPAWIQGVNKFKWHDWCASMKLSYEPMQLLSDPIATIVRKLVLRIHFLDKLYFRVFVKQVPSQRYKKRLSQDTVIRQKLERLEEVIDQFKRSYR